MKKNTWFADFETTTLKVRPDPQLYAWGAKCERSNVFYRGIDMKSFFDLLKKKKVKKVYFHNLSFDGTYITPVLINSGFKYRNVKSPKMLKENEWRWLVDDKNNTYSIDMNYKGHRVKIWCSLKLLSSSVSDLGNQFGFPKGDIDYDAYDVFNSIEELEKEKDLLKYLERDIDIVKKSYINFVNNIGVDPSLTIAGTAKKIMIQMIGQEKFTKRYGGIIPMKFENKYTTKDRKLFYNVLTQNEWDTIKKSYNAGYTMVNPKYKNKQLENINGYAYDEISEYPSIMLNEKLPYGTVKYEKSEGDYSTLYVVQVSKLSMKENSGMPPFIKVIGRTPDEQKQEIDKFGYEVPHYTFGFDDTREYVWWEEEFEFIKKHYDIEYKISKTMYFTMDKGLSPFISKYGGLKQNAKSKAEAYPYKILINSSYGKFGEKYVKDGNILVDDPNNILDEKYYIGSHKIVKEPIRKEIFAYIPVASYICMKARLNLLRMIEANVEIFLYCDTDSIYTSDEPVIPKGQYVDDNVFGAWKPEGRFDKFKAIKPKTYSYRPTHEYIENGIYKKVTNIDMSVKASGLSKDAKNKMTWDTFYSGNIIKDGKTGKFRGETGMAITKIDITL